MKPSTKSIGGWCLQLSRCFRFLAARQPDLDAAGMRRRGGEDLPHDAARPLARRLISLEDHLDEEAGMDVLPAFAVHAAHSS